ncbi:hypothetical protein V8E51_012180 [Hyaloscypha variabilis]|uniref:Rhodopsin domain-containing protein n=1 Tax=Hyaloscypha variabilis (strain UAMH 11265 / GT02V1 / F) TaxID=1149755 RepID=A0A2J6RVX3_HYAVF|nr:hypothetical protein L207DRAFT_632406 [Hyaloscypha variabilis F]
MSAPPAQLSHATRGPEMVIINCVLLSVASIVVALRFYTRIKITHFVGSDDWWMLAAWIIGVAQVGLWNAYAHFGNGSHIWNVPTQHLSKFFQILWVIQMIYPLGMGLVKISCLSLYLRLFSSERFRIVIYCSMAFVVAMTIATIFSAVFECIPIESNWVLSEWATRKCINRADQQYATSALAFTTDIAVLFLPMKYLLQLRVSTREKIQVIALMLLGSLTCIASIIRFKWIHFMQNSTDSTWDGFYLSVWTSIEFHFAVITTSIPAIKPLYVKIVQKFLHKNDSTPLHSDQSKEPPIFFLQESKLPAIV